VIRDNSDPDILARHIVDFLEANERHIKARRLIIDFRAGLAPFVTVACRRALKNASAGILVDVIIVT
jgi:hypothetical protein